jgi:hypothetical protein
VYFRTKTFRASFQISKFGILFKYSNLNQRLEIKE